MPTTRNGDPTHAHPAVTDYAIATLPGSNRRLIVCPTIEHPLDSQHCVFCGGSLTGLRSREHVFPCWLTDHYGTAAQPFQIRWTADWSHELRGEREITMSSLVAGRVCRRCNNGWMSQLETDVAQPLLALASGNRPLAELTTDERALVARWATKTAFALRVADLGPKVVQPGEARALVTGGMPCVQVVARQSDVDLGLGWYTTQWWMVDYPPDAVAECSRLVGRSHKTILTVGRLVFAVCFWPDPKWALVVSKRSHNPLWPARGVWLTYSYATDRHGAPPTVETEIIDMVVGTRIAHPARQQLFLSVDAPWF